MYCLKYATLLSHFRLNDVDFQTIPDNISAIYLLTWIIHEFNRRVIPLFIEFSQEKYLCLYYITSSQSFECPRFLRKCPRFLRNRLTIPLTTM